MPNHALAKAAEHITLSHPEFSLETLEIRGAPLRVFKHAPKNLADLLTWAVGIHGDRELLVHGNERLTYRAFSEKVTAVAAALKKVVGVQAGDRLAIAMRNRIEYLIFAMAIASVGGVVVHLNAWWTSEELDFALSDCGAKVVLADAERLQRLQQGKNAANLCLVATDDTGDFNYSFGHFLALGMGLDPEPEPVLSDEDCAIIYTSGSTGHPKGVVLTHRNILSAIWSWLMIGLIQDQLGSPSVSTVEPHHQLQPANLVTVPFFHVSGMNTCFLLTLAMGGKVVLLDKWDAESAADLISQESITRFWGVPTMTADLLSLGARARDRLATLGSLDAGGAKRPPDQVARIVANFPDIQPSTGYGMTETSGLGLRVAGADYSAKPDAAGYLLPPLQDLQIVDDYGAPVPMGQIGELTLRGPSVMRCYLNQPEATAEILHNGWLHTGDLAKIDGDGMVFIVGRKKDIIIRGGENISSLEVEAAVHAYPDIMEAAAFSVPDDRLGEIVGVAVHGKALNQLDIRRLRGFLAPRVAHFKLPERLWVFADPLPRGATEKIDKRKVRQICLGELSPPPTSRFRHLDD